MKARRGVDGDAFCTAKISRLGVDGSYLYFDFPESKLNQFLLPSLGLSHLYMEVGIIAVNNVSIYLIDVQDELGGV